MKRVIVTGSSDGLGKAFAKECIQNGIEVVAVSRSETSGLGSLCHPIVADFTKEEDIEKACSIIKEKYSEFDAIVHCAGLISVQEPDKITYNELENTMKVNSLAPIFFTSKLFNEIKKNEADIINVGSTQGTKASVNQAAYVSSKWAIRGTSKTFDLELKNTRCRVMQLNVGGMNTKFWEKYNGQKIENPNEWMQPEDVAKVMLYFLRLPKSIQMSEVNIDRKKQ